MLQIENMKYSKSIDSLKGIAMLGIILVHSRLSFGNIFQCIVNNGARGVQLTFIISGYLIFKSLENAYQKKTPLKTWYRGKILRIIPLYWFFTILHIIVFGRGERFYLGPLKEVSWLNIICNLLCIHGFFPYYANSINVNWYIADLMLWYLIAPVIYRVFNSLKKVMTGLLFGVPIIYSILILLKNKPIISSIPIWNDYVNVFFFGAQLPIIFLGIVIYWLEKEKRIEWLSNIKGSFFAATFCILLLTIGSDKFFVFNTAFSFSLCFSVIFVLQLVKPVGFLCNSILALYGKYSYSIYLSHLFVVSGVWKVLGENRSYSNIKQVGIYIAICIISLIVSICVEKTEKVMRGIIKR